MSSKLIYFKNFIKTLFWPFLLWLGQFFLIFIFTIFFNMQYLNTLKEQYPNFTNSEINTEFQEVLNSSKYIQELNSFLVDKNIIIMLILTAIILPFLIKQYKKYSNDKKIVLKNNKLIKIIVTSMFLAVILNLIFYLINNIIPFTNRYNITSTSLSIIITTGLLAPILEEFIFRGILFNKLKKFNSKKTAMILTVIIFALFHLEISQIIYATIVGAYLIYLYDKTENIKISIMAHIIINISTILFLPFIINTNIFIQIGLIIILGLGIYHNFCIKQK